MEEGRVFVGGVVCYFIQIMEEKARKKGFAHCSDQSFPATAACCLFATQASYTAVDFAAYVLAARSFRDFAIAC